MGTFATFQGFPLRELHYTYGRGYQPGTAVMVIGVEAFPAGFGFRAPQPGALGQAKGEPGETVDPTEPGPAPLARAFDYEGFLVLRETAGGEEWKLPPIRLFVVSVTTRKAAQNGRALVEVVAVDVRFHWDRGWCRRHTYNRRRPDGTVALDSVGKDGQPLTREAITADVLSCLFRSPRLARVPDDWKLDTSSVQFLPNAAPVVNLAQLVTSSELEEPCLFLDGSVGLFRPGEGMVGFTDSPGAPNSRPFPPHLLPDKGGTGQADVVQWIYPEDYVVVAGGLKIVSVALDDCVPVLDVNGATIELTEENVRTLTDDRFGLDWLTRFVLLPADFAGGPDLDEPIARLFREQAFRLWQIPGAEVTRAADEGSPGLTTVREPGPNAHLLPVLPRAETVAGRRLSPIVETYTFAMRTKALEGGGASGRQREAIRKLNEIRAEIVAHANRQGKTNPFAGSTKSWTGPIEALENLDRMVFGDGTPVAAPVDLREVIKATERPGDGFPVLDTAGVIDELQGAINQARLVERITEQASGELAAQYEQALREHYAAIDEAGGFASRIYETAKTFLELEKAAREKRKLDQSLRDAFREGGYTERLKNELDKLAREWQLREEERKRRELVGGQEGAGVESITFFVNVARTVDAGARVYDAERGIFETSGLAGHLVNPAIHDLGHPDAQLSLCPVRVVFGAHLRPRLDVPYGTKPRPQTGQEPQEGDAVRDCSGGDNVIPEALTDEETYYLAAFKRGPSGGAVPIPPEDVPRGEALVVRRPDLVELVALDGSSNRAHLDLEAAKVAAELFRLRPLVKATRTTVAHLWPVNCDGVVERVEIVMRQKDGAPCGFETTVYSGSGGSSDPVGGTREDPARRGTAALRAQQEAAKRERVQS